MPRSTRSRERSRTARRPRLADNDNNDNNGIIDIIDIIIEEISWMQDSDLAREIERNYRFNPVNPVERGKSDCPVFTG
jgi:hypothetical protein